MRKFDFVILINTYFYVKIDVLFSFRINANVVSDLAIEIDPGDNA